VAVVADLHLLQIWEGLLVEFSDFEDRTVVGLKLRFSVGVGAWPFIEIEFVAENFGVEEEFHLGAEVDQINQVILKHVREHIRVLVLRHVLNNQVERQDLVVCQTDIKHRVIIFILEEDWELGGEVLTVFVA
jgi:hypothetical protein